MNQSDNIAELATALSKAQSEIQGAKKDCANPFFKSKYADLSSVWDACREPLTKNGLSVIQTTCDRDGRVYLHTLLAHSSGQWIRSELQVITSKPDIQALGSSLTYCRRYSLAMIAGVCPEDDDGNAAAQAPKANPTIPNNEPKITLNQIAELKIILSECPNDLVAALFSSLKCTIEQIPSSRFDGIIAYLRSKIETQGTQTNE